MRVEEDVRQPRPPDLRTDARLGIHRIAFPLLRRHVDAERAEISGVEHVGRIDLLQIECELRAVGVRDRVHDDVHLVQLLAVGGIGQEQLRHLQHVARRRHLVRMLPRRVHDRRLHRRLLGLRPVGRLDRRHQIHRPDVFAEIALADFVNGRLFEGRHPREDLRGFGRRNRRVPLHERRRAGLEAGPQVGRPSNVGKRRGHAVRIERGDDFSSRLALVLPRDRDAQPTEGREGGVHLLR